MVVAFAVLLGASACAKAPTFAKATAGKLEDKSRSSRRTTELQEFKVVRYVPNESNDGDSFLVMLGDEERRVRLYFVDCPEATAGSKADAARVREQMRYFGLESAGETMKFGAEAAKFTRKALGKPFTVHTSFASALGRSAGGRVYAFITTSTGEDLARLLVTNGYARTFGVYRKTPEGVRHDEMKKQLEDLELCAAIKLVGIWAKTDPDRLAQLRKKQRQEDEELKESQRIEAAGRRKPLEHDPLTPWPRNKYMSQGKSGHVTGFPVDINKASKRELQKVKGIGLVLSQRIIDGRPYESVDDLLKVKGIGKRSLEKMRARFYVP